jgi:hypothetical protein
MRALLVACLPLAALLAADPARTAGEESKALVEGRMPDDPALKLVQGKCLLCHSGDYLTQQRLTEGQWQRTVDKMRKFGTPATDEEAKAMVSYLARYWTPALAPPRPTPSALPRGSVSGK